MVLRILELNPSTYYYSISRETEEKEENGGRPIPGYSYTIDGRKVCDMQIKEWIMELIEGDGFGYGYYKLTIALRKEYNLIINKKKVYRLCKELGILKHQREIKLKHPRRLARNRIVTAPNQLWEADIKYGYIAGEDRFFYVLSIIDVYDRMVVDYHIGLSCEGSDAVITLQRALMRRNLYEKENKPVIRTDNGPQFISHAFESRCEELKIEHERIPCKTPDKNAHIEAFHRILEDECLGRWEFEKYEEGYREVVEFMDRYNTRRIHSSIFYMSPREFYMATIAGTARTLEIRV